MASWTTPITDWDGVSVNRKYYNFGDWDRVEEDTEYLKDAFADIGYNADTTTFTYPRTKTSWNQYKSDINRMELNILAIKNATWEPLTWVEPITSWTSVRRAFGYIDSNRIEGNLLYLYNLLNNITDAYVKCGEPQAVCGELQGLF